MEDIEVLVVSPDRFLRQKCSDTPSPCVSPDPEGSCAAALVRRISASGCQAPPQNSNRTDRHGRRTKLSLYKLYAHNSTDFSPPMLLLYECAVKATTCTGKGRCKHPHSTPHRPRPYAAYQTIRKSVLECKRGGNLRVAS